MIRSGRILETVPKWFASGLDVEEGKMNQSLGC